jgi:hypothetical protein
MATKVDRTAKTALAGADDLAVLHPEREIFLAGRRVVIREYGFVEGLRIRTHAQPFLDALYALAGSEGRAPSFTQVESLLADHSECVLSLIARAADVEVEWITGLSDSDGYLLMQEWWLVTSGFFIRRVVQRLATERAVARLPAGPASTPRSSEPASDAHPPTSERSPLDS